jgi:hypothetical protein
VCACVCEDIDYDKLQKLTDDAEVFIVTGSTWYALLIKGTQCLQTPRGRSALIREHKRDIDTPQEKLPATLFVLMDNFVKNGSWESA